VDGTYSLLARSTTGNTFTVYQDVPVSPGQAYSLASQVRVPTASGQFRATVQLVARNVWGGTLSTASAPSQTTTNSTWTSANTSIVIPNGGASLRVQIKLEYLKADVYLDRVVLTRTS
jgi:hypothetical protein